MDEQARSKLRGPIGRRVISNRREILRMIRTAGASNPRLFGSVARGVETETSDLDIAVDFPVRELGLIPLAHLADEISQVLEVHVDVVASTAVTAAVESAVNAESVAL